MSLNIKLVVIDEATPRIYKAMKRTDSIVLAFMLARKGYRLISKRGRWKLEQL